MAKLNSDCERLLATSSRCVLDQLAACTLEAGYAGEAVRSPCGALGSRLHGRASA